jgi:hypothetical protein
LTVQVALRLGSTVKPTFLQVPRLPFLLLLLPPALTVQVALRLGSTVKPTFLQVPRLPFLLLLLPAVKTTPAAVTTSHSRWSRNPVVSGSVARGRMWAGLLGGFSWCRPGLGQCRFRI